MREVSQVKARVVRGGSNRRPSAFRNRHHWPAVTMRAMWHGRVGMV